MNSKRVSKVNSAIIQESSLPRATIKSTKQVMKQVVVPTNGRSSVGSTSSGLDQLSEYDTPATSEAVTPAESLVKGVMTGRRSSSMIHSHTNTKDLERRVHGKRKRLHEEGLVASDALIAQRLQEVEYNETPVLPTKRRRDPIEDSEEISLSSPSSEASSSLGNGKLRGANNGLPRFSRLNTSSTKVKEEDSEDAEDVPHSKRVKASHRATLPSRAARSSARKSIRTSNARQILDSEDSDMSDNLSDVSLFSSEADSEISDASEASGDDTLEQAQGLDPATMAQVVPQPAVPVRRRRRVPRSQANTGHRIRRRERFIEDRVREFTLKHGMLIETNPNRPRENAQSLRKRIQKSKPCGIH